MTTNFLLVDALQRLGYDSNEAITRSDRIMSKKAEDAFEESKHPREGGKFTSGSGGKKTASEKRGGAPSNGTVFHHEGLSKRGWKKKEGFLEGSGGNTSYHHPEKEGHQVDLTHRSGKYAGQEGDWVHSYTSQVPGSYQGHKQSKVIGRGSSSEGLVNHLDEHA